MRETLTPHAKTCGFAHAAATDGFRHRHATLAGGYGVPFARAAVSFAVFLL
jgi:hypothetical protein